MQALRYWDYYGMTESFTDLYERASKQETFHISIRNHHIQRKYFAGLSHDEVQ